MYECFAVLIISKTRVLFRIHYIISVCFLRQDKESWIRSKYVEKKFIHKLPETGRGTVLRRSSARRNRATTQDRPSTRPPIKPKPNRATLPRLTGTQTHMLKKLKIICYNLHILMQSHAPKNQETVYIFLFLCYSSA